MNIVIIIPARYESSRFPGKPLVNILGKSLIQRVWEQCIKIIDSEDVYIATDDSRIKNHCKENNMQCIMTNKECLTGTDRVAEAYNKIGKNYENIINVQGDEPLIKPEDILKVSKYVRYTRYPISCGYCKIKLEEEFRNPNIIKIVNNSKSDLLYASRAAIPTNKNLEFQEAYKQVCVYGFTDFALSSFYNFGKKYGKGNLEKVEDIEILRFLELGEKIKMQEVSSSSISVDVPEDIVKIEEVLKGE